MNTALLAREKRPEVTSRSVPKDSASDLKIGEPSDVFEQEADRMADQVMAGGGTTLGWSFSKMSVGAPVQRQATDSVTPSVAPPIVHEVLRSPGRPLDQATRGFFEPRFSHDFSDVRVHTDSAAAESARAVHAQAYTVGRSIVFGEGEYRPTEGRGRRLIAHELAHVVQRSSKRGDRAAPNLQRQPKKTAVIGPPDPKAFAAADPEAAMLLTEVLKSAGSKGIPVGTPLSGGTLPAGGKITFVFGLNTGLSAFGKTTLSSATSVGQANGEIIISMVFNPTLLGQPGPTQTTWFHEFQHALILISQELVKDAGATSGAGSAAATTAMKSSRTAGRYWSDLAAANLLPESKGVATSYRTLVGAARKATSGTIMPLNDADVIEHAINERRAYLEQYGFMTANKRTAPSPSGLPGIIAGTLISTLKGQLAPAEQTTFDASDSQLGLRSDLEAKLTALFSKLP